MKTIHTVGMSFSIDRHNEHRVNHPPAHCEHTSGRRFLGLMVVAAATCFIGAALLLLSLGRSLMLS
jgi:hypothetical protein